MLCGAYRRPLVRVRGEKRKGCVVIPPVLREVEVDAAHDVPCRIELLEHFLGRRVRLRPARRKGIVDRLPQCRECIRIDVLGTLHGGYTERERLEVGDIGRRDGRVLRRFAWTRAESGDVPSAQLTPVREGGWQQPSDFGASQLEQAGAGALGERLTEALFEAGGELRRVRRGSDSESTVRSDDRSDAHTIGRSGVSAALASSLPGRSFTRPPLASALPSRIRPGPRRRMRGR